LPRSDPNIVVPCEKIELGVDVCTFELVNEVRNKGYAVLVLSGQTVQASVVDAHSQRTILLFAKTTGEPPGDCDDQMKPLLSMSSR
jgi:hypothetical protein